MAWYRPPNYETKTLTEVNTLLETLEKEQKETLLIGDVNCNDLDLGGKNKVLETLRNIYREYQLKQLIRNPTRSTLTSQTLIDHFATNKPKLIIKFGVFTTGFSDHDLIFGIRKVSPRVNREPKIIKSRQLKNYDPVKFCRDLGKVNRDLILKQDSVHSMSSEFENCFVTILDKHAPLRQHKVRNTYAPYIDHELRHKMFLRDFYKKQFNKTKNPDTWKQQKKKTEFFTRKLNEHKGDVRSMWKVLNMALGSKSKTTNFNTLSVKGKEISDPKEIANALNSHFCTTAKRVWEQSTQSQIKNATDVATFESFIS